MAGQDWRAGQISALGWLKEFPRLSAQCEPPALGNELMSSHSKWPHCNTSNFTPKTAGTSESWECKIWKRLLIIRSLSKTQLCPSGHDAIKLLYLLSFYYLQSAGKRRWQRKWWEVCTPGCHYSPCLEEEGTCWPHHMEVKGLGAPLPNVPNFKWF